MQSGQLAFALAALSGAFDVGFALFHLLFWRIFDWHRTILPSGALNSAITQTLNVMLTYCFVLYGGWLLWAVAAGTRPDPMLLGAGAGFWLLRAVLQPMLFGLRRTASVTITVIFGLGTVLHLSAALA